MHTARVRSRLVRGEVFGSHAGGVRRWWGLPANQRSILTTRILEICILAHVFRDGSIADRVRCGWNAGLAAIAAPAAIKAWHVYPVQVVVGLPVPLSGGLILSLII